MTVGFRLNKKIELNYQINFTYYLMLHKVILISTELNNFNKINSSIIVLSLLRVSLIHQEYRHYFF